MFKIIFFIFFILFFNLNTFSAETEYFLMLKNKKVNVRFGPNMNSPVKYVYKKINLPVKVIDKKENFRRIIDHKKNSGWIHISQLKKSKSLITTSKKILFNKPTKYSKPLAKLDIGRLLLTKKCNRDWCIVKTGEFTGWVSKDNIWGKVN
tara:strand:- start:64 stop:513 length:450 start_codon:yes stop_codon:yes gene_type:complete